jgi:hypothetical protein
MDPPHGWSPGRWRVIDGAPEGIDLKPLITAHKTAARAFA